MTINSKIPWRYEIKDDECRILAGDRIIAYVHYGPMIAAPAESNAKLIVDSVNEKMTGLVDTVEA